MRPYGRGLMRLAGVRRCGRWWLLVAVYARCIGTWVHRIVMERSGVCALFEGGREGCARRVLGVCANSSRGVGVTVVRVDVRMERVWAWSAAAGHVEPVLAMRDWSVRMGAGVCWVGRAWSVTGCCGHAVICGVRNPQLLSLGRLWSPDG